MIIKIFLKNTSKLVTKNYDKEPLLLQSAIIFAKICFSCFLVNTMQVSTNGRVCEFNNSSSSSYKQSD